MRLLFDQEIGMTLCIINKLLDLEEEQSNIKWETKAIEVCLSYFISKYYENMCKISISKYKYSS